MQTMSSPTAHAEPLAAAQSGLLLQQITLSQAARLARAGNHASAEQLLEGLLQADASNLDAWDLLARIKAQQGALLEAASVWRNVLQQNPGHIGARAGLERIRRMQSAPIGYRWPLLAAIGFGVAACGVHFLSLQAGMSARISQQMQSLAGEVAALKSDTATKLPPNLNGFGAKLDSIDSKTAESAAAQANLTKKLADIQDETKRMTQQLNQQIAGLGLAAEKERALREEVERLKGACAKLESDNHTQAETMEMLKAQIPVPVQAPTLDAKVPGVTTSVSGTRLTMIFDDGLFDHGIHFKPDAQKRLLEAAKAITRSSLNPLQIQVIGCAGDERSLLRWTSASSLARDRALTVVSLLKTSGLFQQDNLSASEANGNTHPANASDEKTRTVILQIIPSQNAENKQPAKP